ncbi:MAG: type II secretion system F family protein [Alphaproteobacteria bacterium]|nr:type II secretion system F family protein [Alphaproteobacteria bacterium]
MIDTQQADWMSFMQGDMLVYAAGIGMVMVVLLVWHALSGSEVTEKRLKSVMQRRDDLRSELKAQSTRREGLLQKDFFKQLAATLKNTPWLYSDNLRKNLARAGLRNKEAVGLFAMTKIGLPIILFILALFLTAGLGIAEKKPLIKLLMMLGLPIVAFVVPDTWLKNAIQKREDVLRKSLPDAFDLLVICAEAGLGLDAALDRVAREMTQSTPVLAEEIGITAVELGFLPDRRVALMGFAERVQLPSVRALVNTLTQSERYGTPLAQALRVLSSELREERMMKAEEKAAKLPATLTVPMILFILPTLFIVLLGPAIIRVFDLNH